MVEDWSSRGENAGNHGNTFYKSLDTSSYYCIFYCQFTGVYHCTQGVKRAQVVQYLASLIMSSAPGAKWSVVAIILEIQAQPNDLRQPIAPATPYIILVRFPKPLYINMDPVWQLTKIISPVSTRVFHENMFLMKKIGSTRSASIWGLL